MTMPTYRNFVEKTYRLIACLDKSHVTTATKEVNNEFREVTTSLIGDLHALWPYFKFETKIRFKINGEDVGKNIVKFDQSKRRKK